MNRQFILASGSPRRKQLLGQLGFIFDVEVSDIDETPGIDEAPEQYVERLAREKAASVADNHSESVVVLAADTTVVFEGNILGKPESKEHGLEMLRMLSGSTHDVFTGVSATKGEVFRTLTVKTAVVFRELSLNEANWYWSTGEPQDKAGGYGLQGAGAAFVTSLEGSYSNVIGLPLSETVDLLRGFGVASFGDEGFGASKNEFEVDVRQSNG